MEYVITCESDTEKERWLDAVSPPKSNLVGETLYESWDCPQVMALYSYSPGQPDELAMQPGEKKSIFEIFSFLKSKEKRFLSTKINSRSTIFVQESFSFTLKRNCR